MRVRTSQGTAEHRIAKRYHRLVVPLIELVQSLQDLAPDGMQISEKVELERSEGYINISYTTKPIELVIVEGKQRFSLKVEEVNVRKAS